MHLIPKTTRPKLPKDLGKHAIRLVQDPTISLTNNQDHHISKICSKVRFATGKRTAFTDVKSAEKKEYESILKKFMGSPKNMSFKQMQEGSAKSSQGANE